MASLRFRGPPLRGVLLAVLVLAAIPVTGETVAAQGSLSCLNCDFELVTVEWNGSAMPGALTGGTFEIRNTGESPDRYSITAIASDDDWTVETEPTETAEVPPGSGVFASDENATTFQVRVLVPEDAPANARTTVTIRVESLNDDDLEDETTAEARAKQTYGWDLECTPTLTIQKSKHAEIALNATNTGNGRDRAEVIYTPVEGITIADPKPFEAAAGATQRQTIDVGVGLRADDGTYTVRWDLRSTGDATARTDCTTLVEVVGGAPDGTGTNGDDENGESPAIGLPFLVLLGVGLAMARRMRGR